MLQKSFFNLFLFFSILLCACHSIDDKNRKLNCKDTTQIITAIVSAKRFLMENQETETLFFLKNNLYNNAWPDSTSRFKFVFIENNSRSRMFNIGPGFPYDGRQRLSLLKFTFRNDTCNTVIQENGSNLFYETKSIYKNKIWDVIEERVRVGGRVERFEFENEDWYKNWKQKIPKQENLLNR